MKANIKILANVAARRLTGWITGYKPFILSHLVTGKCNFTCKSCLWKDNASEDMTLAEIENLYKQAREEGFIATYIWGGEPLLRKDIKDILAAAHKHGLITFINTNAWYLSEKIDEIYPYLDAVIVSLDHPESTGHDKIRGVKGAYERVKDSVAKIRSKYPDLRVIVNTLALNDNQNEILKILDIWKDMGVRGYVNFMEVDLLESEGFKNRKLHVDVDERGRRNLAQKLSEAKRGGAPILNTQKYFANFQEGKKSYPCHFPKIFLEVYPDGSVVDCVNVDRPIANLKTNPLKTVLNHPRIRGMVEDGEKWCHVHNNADRIDASLAWEFHPEALTNLVQFL